MINGLERDITRTREQRLTAATDFNTFAARLCDLLTIRGDGALTITQSASNGMESARINPNNVAIAMTDNGANATTMTSGGNNTNGPAGGPPLSPTSGEKPIRGEVAPMPQQQQQQPNPQLTSPRDTNGVSIPPVAGMSVMTGHRQSLWTSPPPDTIMLKVPVANGNGNTARGTLMSGRRASWEVRSPQPGGQPAPFSSTSTLSPDDVTAARVDLLQVKTSCVRLMMTCDKVINSSFLLRSNDSQIF